MRPKKLIKPIYNFFFKKKKRKRRNAAVSTQKKATAHRETPQQESRTHKYDLRGLREQVSETEYIANLRIGRSWVLPQMVKMGFVKSGMEYHFDIQVFEKHINEKYGSLPNQRRNVWELMKRNYRDIANSNGKDIRSIWWTKDVLMDVLEWDFQCNGKKTKGLFREECEAVISKVPSLTTAEQLSAAIDWYDVNRMRHRYVSVKYHYSTNARRLTYKVPASFVEAYMADGAYSAMMTMVKFWGVRIKKGDTFLERDECICLINQKSKDLSCIELLQYCKETFFDTGIFDCAEYVRH